MHADLSSVIRCERHYNPSRYGTWWSPLYGSLHPLLIEVENRFTGAIIGYIQIPHVTVADDVARRTQYSLRCNTLESSENLIIAPLQCFACSKKAKFLKILSGNINLTSIKGQNYVTNLRKTTANNPNLDLVSINCSIKFGQNVSISSQDIERKQNSGVNQEPLL